MRMTTYRYTTERIASTNTADLCNQINNLLQPGQRVVVLLPIAANGEKDFYDVVVENAIPAPPISL